MRCYKVETEIVVSNQELGERDMTVFQYASTQADAKLIRDQWVIKHSLKKKDISIEPAEIPMAKAELLTFINGLITVSEEE